MSDPSHDPRVEQLPSRLPVVAALIRDILGYLGYIEAFRWEQSQPPPGERGRGKDA